MEYAEDISGTLTNRSNMVPVTLDRPRMAQIIEALEQTLKDHHLLQEPPPSGLQLEPITKLHEGNLETILQHWHQLFAQMYT